MDLLETTRKDLIQDEGMKLKPYRCTAGKLSIGAGRNLDDNGISRAEAETLLNNDIVRCAEELSSNLHFFAELPDHAKRALINMCYNMGIAKLLKFKNMLADLSAHDYKADAAEAMNSAWATQVGDRAKRVCADMRGEGRC